MTLPHLPFGHTPFEAAFDRGDVYAVRPDPARAAKRPLRVGLIGAGGIAQAKWLPAIQRLRTEGEPVTVAGIADPDPATREKVGRIWSVPALPDAEALIAAARDGGGIDLALVLCPDHAHAAVSRLCLEAGVAVLVEKPVCHSLREAVELCDLAERRGLVFASVANKRFSPPYALARRLVAEGWLKGPPTLFQGKFTLGYPYVDLLEAGTIHLLDLALWLMGPVTRLHAEGRRVRRPDGSEAIEAATATLAFASGAAGGLVTSAQALSFKPWERVEIIGRGAMLTVEDQFELTLWDEETGPAKSWRPAIPNTLLFDESFGGYAGLLENVLDALRGIAPLAAPARDGAAALELAAAIRLSLRLGRPVTLPLDPATADEALGRALPGPTEPQPTHAA